LFSASGTVYAGEDLNGRPIAIKRMKLSNQNIASILSEVDILRNSSHPNIIRFIEAYITERELWVHTLQLMNTKAWNTA
jgi:p21-activated kinase 1